MISILYFEVLFIMIKKENIIFHGVCFGLSVLIVFLLGYPQRVDRVLLTYFSLIFLARFKFFRIIFCINFVITAFYFPVSFYYGYPNVAVVSALSETSTEEIGEFCTQLPIYFYLIPLVLAGFFILIFTRFKFAKFKNKYLIIIALLLSCYKPVKENYRHDLSAISLQSILYNIKYPLFEFYIDFFSSFKIYTAEKEEQLKQTEQTNTIPILAVHPTHKTYIIIIGESVRKDYMSAYGFSYNDTPFTKQNASILWDGLIAPGSNTQASIPHLISQSLFSENKVNTQLNNNIISIANEAGFETHWLSNQGKLGKMEITVPRIAAYAQYNFHTKKGEYNGKSARGKHDTLLLPKLEEIVSNSNSQDKPKLIIMHLIGSHPHFCKRLQYDVQFDLNNKNISCYISSIKETDDFIKSTIEILNKHNTDYSVVYFADHGLAHTERYQDLRHNSDFQNSYQVPFIFFDSKIVSQQKINKQISGFQLVYLLSHWLGITLDVQHDYMQNELTDIPEQKNIKVKDWHNDLSSFDKLKKDPNPF